jgi:hypothetical protein
MTESINDMRQTKDFQYTTFCNFKRSDVKKEFLKALANSKIEAGCFWSAEMICSGYFEDLWDSLIYFYSKWVHLGNVKLVHLLSRRFDFFKRIYANDLTARNHQTIRVLFAELVCVLCLSKKKNGFNSIEIKKELFDLAEMKEILKAPTLDFAKDIIREDEDSHELTVPVNEFCYALSTKNTMQCFYWIEWLLEYETRCVKRREKLKLGRRDKICRLEKFQKDMAWLIWECLQKEIDKTNIKAFLQEIFQSCVNLFHLNYNTVRGKKKKFLLFFLCSALIEPFDMSDNIVEKSQMETLSNVKENIDKVYKQIKKNEMFGHLEYLNLIPTVKKEKEKTLEQLNLLFNTKIADATDDEKK